MIATDEAAWVEPVEARSSTRKRGHQQPVATGMVLERDNFGASNALPGKPTQPGFLGSEFGEWACLFELQKQAGLAVGSQAKHPGVRLTDCLPAPAITTDAQPFRQVGFKRAAGHA